MLAKHALYQLSYGPSLAPMALKRDAPVSSTTVNHRRYGERLERMDDEAIW